MERVIAARPATESAYVLAEGPVWDAAWQRLLWVDVVAGTVFTGSLEAGSVVETSALTVDETVGAVVPAPSGELLVAGRRDLHLVDVNGHSRRLIEVIPADKQSRLNDGACDPAGRFLVGSMALDGRPGQDCLYRWDAAGMTTLDDDLTLSNGLAWSPDGTTLYSIDTTPGIVWQRSYDPVTGDVGSRSELLRITDGSPDGMCLDADGRLWIAVWGAGEVRCFRPDGEQVAVVQVAAPHTSSVAFVGPELRLLLITTARNELSDEQLANAPDSGRLFLADVGVAGLPVPGWTPLATSAGTV
jgi:sugar lactone lactonase YvrE